MQDILNISIPTFITIKATIIDAIGSSNLIPKIEPPIPINAAIDDNASDLWCQASAFKASEFIFLAAFIVILY